MCLAGGLVSTSLAPLRGDFLQLKVDKAQVRKAREAPQGHMAGEPGQGRVAAWLRGFPQPPLSTLRPGRGKQSSLEKSAWTQVGSHLFPLNCLPGQLQATRPCLPPPGTLSVLGGRLTHSGPWLGAKCMNDGWETPHTPPEPLWNTERH